MVLNDFVRDCSEKLTIRLDVMQATICVYICIDKKALHMKIILSPAKSLDYNRDIQTPEVSIAPFIEEADRLAKKLKRMSKADLGALMKLSANLTDLNYERYQKWEQPSKLKDDVQPAITVFTGEVYKGLAVEDWETKDILQAQKDIRILSGLYGLLRPLDLMYPYRLEMGTKWKINKNQNNLYEFWGSRLADFLNDEMEEDEVVINLASKEYFRALGEKRLNARVITPVFKELKGDQYKVVMMYAKHARGAMARDIVQNQYDSAEDLKGYNVDGYSYSEQMSTQDEWVFVR